MAEQRLGESGLARTIVCDDGDVRIVFGSSMRWSPGSSPWTPGD